MACSEPNLYAFMGEHWFLTVVLAVIIMRVLAPVSVAILAIAWRIMGHR